MIALFALLVSCSPSAQVVHHVDCDHVECPGADVMVGDLCGYSGCVYVVRCSWDEYLLADGWHRVTLVYERQDECYELISERVE